jgi:hypothetical protein
MPSATEKSSLDPLVQAAVALFLLTGSAGIIWRAAWLTRGSAARPIGGIVEAEDLTVLGQSRPFGFFPQTTSGFGSQAWTKGGHMFAEAGKAGDWIELRLPKVGAGRYEIYATLTRSRDFGIVQFSVNGSPAGKPIDLWSGPHGGIERTGPLSLGTFALKDEPGRLKLEVVGHHPENRAPFYQFGIDGIWMEKK